MKKFIGIILSMVLLLTGCSSDEDYIETAKSITFSDGQTIKQYVEDNIKAGEMYQKNDSSLFLNEQLLFLMNLGGKSEIQYILRKSGIVLPENIEPATWSVEGDIKDGKVLIATNNDIKVRIETVKNGDYIETSTDKIEVFNKESNKLITKDELEAAFGLYNLAIKNDYTNLKPGENIEIDQEYKRFDEQAVLENKDGIYTLSYYPDGRVKYLSDDVVVYLELEDRSYIKDIEEELVFLDKEIEKYSDESINKLVDFSVELEHEIIAEKLYKKISNEEKREIQKLEEKATKIFNKLQNQVNKISE